MRGADGDTDHLMLRSQFRFRKCSYYHTKQPNANKYKTYNLTTLNIKLVTQRRNTDLKNTVQKMKYHEDMPAAEYWNTIKEKINTTSKTVLGYKKKMQQDWFADENGEINNLLEGKKQVFIKWQADKTNKIKHDALKVSKARAQRETRRLQNEWWIEKSREILVLADRNDSRGFYGAIKAIYKPKYQRKTAVKDYVGNLILNRQSVMKRREGYFKHLLNNTTGINMNLLQTI